MATVGKQLQRRTISKNPDLLMPDVMTERIRRIPRVWEDRNVPSELDRVTVFVTHRCNLFCTYCNGPHLRLQNGDKTERKLELLRSNLTLSSFRRLLDDAARFSSIKHMHFTGGEPTMCGSLPEMVELAASRGILTSLTTNGTAKPEIYSRLVEAGMTEMRVSIDSHSEAEYERIVGRRNAFGKVVDNIRNIAKMRDEGRDIFLVINACISEKSVDEIASTVKFLVSLDPDDVKLLAISQDKSLIAKHEAEHRMFKAQVFRILSPYSKNSFPLLRYKLERLFDPDASGLKDEQAQQCMEHCLIPLTERTIDGKYYYPCSIYMRGFGEPLGSIDEPFDEQQKKILKFVMEYDCRENSVCATCCTNCCKVFNVLANKEIGTHVLPESIITRPQMDAIIQRLNGLLRTGSADTRPFMVIKPHGQKFKNEILALVKADGLAVDSTVNIANWQECAKYLYFWPPSHDRAAFALEMERIFKTAETGPADVLFFREGTAFEKIISLKYKIRAEFPNKSVLVSTNGHSRIRQVKIAAVHVADDPVEAERESRIIDALVNEDETPRLLKPDNTEQA
ncbi:MAG: radical SAM protein [Candidatus Micrarchaeota archaeon]